MNAIFKRRSIRKYKTDKLEKEIITEILKGAMAAPSAGNARPWEFVVITDRELLDKVPEYHPYSKMIYKAPAAILVCGNLENEIHQGYWVQDCSAATQNILLCATQKGVGSVWLGVFPREDRVKALKEVFSLPERVIPFSIVVLGYADEEKDENNRYEESKIHYNNWKGK